MPILYTAICVEALQIYFCKLQQKNFGMEDSYEIKKSITKGKWKSVNGQKM